MIRRLLPCCAFATLLLTGCAMNSPITGSQDVAADDAISGTVHGGQQPVINATITLYAAATDNYGSNSPVLATTTSNSKGQFRFPAFTCPSPTAPTYVLARGGSPQTTGTTVNANIALGAALGPCSSALSQNIALNEVTTAAMAVTMSRFFTSTLGAQSTDSFGTSPTNVAGLANAMTVSIPLLVNNATGVANGGGTSNGVTTSIETAKVNSIANVIAACVNTTGVGGTSNNCAQLFGDTTPPAGGTAPADTLQAAVQMALYPYQNVTDLYNLSAGAGAPYVGLSSAPNDWTVGASFKTTNMTLGIYLTQNLQTATSMDIDQTGNVWFPTNSSTAHGLAYFNPATHTFAGPYATQLIHPQFVAVDSQGLVWGSDLAGPRLASVSSTNPGAAQTYTTTGATGAISIDSGYPSATDAVVYVDAGAAGLPGKSIYQILGGASSFVYTYNQPAQALLAYGSSPASSQSADAGTAGPGTPCSYETDEGQGSPQQTTASTSASPCNIGGIAPSAVGNDDVITTSNNMLCDGGNNGVGSCFNPPISLSAPENIALDGDLSLWVANSTNSSVSVMGNYIPAGNTKYTHTKADYIQTSPVQYLHNSLNGNTLNTPYGLTIDGSGNVWITNATCFVAPGSDCSVSAFILSELIGAAGPTITPLAVQNNNFSNGNAGYGTRP